MSYQDNLVQSTLNNYIVKNRADFEATKDTFLNNSFIYVDDDGEGLVALQTKTLWTNPIPTSNFAAQTISNLDDISKYDYILVGYIKNTGCYNASQYTIFDKPLFNSNAIRIVLIQADGTYSYCRNISDITKNSITFGSGYINTTSENSACIPTKIIGIKLVNSQAEITNIYSTDETVIGRWIDGKKIYRKVFEFESTLTVSNTTWTDTNINQTSYNIEKIINCRALKDANVWSVNLAGDVSLSNIFLQACRDGNSFPIDAIILEYTKTTD